MMRSFLTSLLSSCVFVHLQLWDLNDLLQGSGNIENHSAVADSDSDGMDVDDAIPKSSKGIH